MVLCWYMASTPDMTATLRIPDDCSTLVGIVQWTLLIAFYSFVERLSIVFETCLRVNDCWKGWWWRVDVKQAKKKQKSSFANLHHTSQSLFVDSPFNIHFDNLLIGNGRQFVCRGNALGFGWGPILAIASQSWQLRFLELPASLLRAAVFGDVPTYSLLLIFSTDAIEGGRVPTSFPRFSVPISLIAFLSTAFCWITFSSSSSWH